MIRRIAPLFGLIAGLAFGAESSDHASAPAAPATALEPPPTFYLPGDQPQGAQADAAATAPAATAAGAKSDATTSAAAQTPPQTPPSTESLTLHPTMPGQPATPEEIASLVRIGQTKVEQGDYVSAELAFRQVLAERATPEQDNAALMGLARTYRKRSDFTKAAAVYETLIKLYPDSHHLPVVYLELGRTLRALGTYKPAIARFYSVINSTLKLPEDNPDMYRQLARTAQFEIAETYFQAGNFEEANRFFSRLKLLDLAPEDRARAHFKSVYALALAGEREKAVIGLRSFLSLNPNDENAPEARYLLAVTLRQLGRFSESLATALELLRAEQQYVQTDPRRWAYWQRKTGNQLANQFYEQGDFNSALIIYQGLLSLAPDPSWRMPVYYQIGLCNERLRLFERARECYQTIVDQLRPAGGGTNVRPELADLADMASWRLQNLSWEQKTQNQLTKLFPATDKTVALGKPSSPDHDKSVHGSTEASPNVVR